MWREIVKCCGYYIFIKSDEICVNFIDFYDVILVVKGVFLDKSGNKDGWGRELIYRVSVYKNG